MGLKDVDCACACGDGDRLVRATNLHAGGFDEPRDGQRFAKGRAGGLEGAVFPSNS
jgi:hypothetical protein